MTVEYEATASTSGSKTNPLKTLAWLEPLSVAALFAFMLWKTWLRWPGPLIDFPRDLYMAWRLSLGDLLYDQVANWYGPLAQLTEAAGFKIFGVGLDTIVWMNIVLTVIVLLLLRAIFGAFGSRLVVWLCSVVFICVFAFGNFIVSANYNFITPYSAQATYGFAGLLLTIWGLLRHLQSGRSPWLGVVGLGLAVAYLDKHEPLFAAVGAMVVYFSAQIIRSIRELPAQPTSIKTWFNKICSALPAMGWLVSGFLLLWLPVFLFFLAQGGLDYALRATNRVPLTMLDQSFIDPVANSRLMQFYFGFDKPWDNFAGQFSAGLALTFVCSVIAAAAWAWARAAKPSAHTWVSPLVVLAAGAAGLAMIVPFDQSKEIGRAIPFPVFLAAALAVGVSLRSAWRKDADFSRMLGLAVVGTGASLMLARMVLNVRIYHFGFFMTPLAVLFLIQLVAGELARPRPGNLRANILLPIAFSLLVLGTVGALTRISLGLYAKKTYSVGDGRDHFYSYPFADSVEGPLLNWMMDSVKKSAPHAKSIVVLPEGIAVNYHLRIPSTVAETEFQPLSLSYVGPQHVLDELQAHPPDVIFLCLRDMSEYDVHYYGENEASGRNILLWMVNKYQDVAYDQPSPLSITHHTADMFVLKSALLTVAPAQK